MPIPIRGTQPAYPPGVDIPQQAPTAVTARPAPFPTRTKQQAAFIAGARTDITCTKFVDKIIFTVSQNGRLGHWVHVPLDTSDPTLLDRRPTQNPSAFSYEEGTEPEPGSDLLPLPHLTATTILGAGAPERDTLGQLLATQVASAVSAQQPEEKRLLVLGMGLGKEMASQIGLEGERERLAFQELVGACVAVL